jgi:hypothetical protein
MTSQVSSVQIAEWREIIVDRAGGVEVPGAVQAGGGDGQQRHTDTSWRTWSRP